MRTRDFLLGDRQSILTLSARGAYFGTIDQKIHSIDRVTGTSLWEYATSGTCVSAPILAADGTLYAVSPKGWIYALDVVNCSERWNVKLNQSFSSLSMGPDGTLYVCGKNLYAIAGSAPLATSDWPTYQRDPGVGGFQPLDLSNGSLGGLSIRFESGRVVLTWSSGSLEASDAATGPWGTLSAGAGEMSFAPTQSARFFRVRR